MKQVLHLCSKIRGLFSASQCSDVGYDCRFTVVRPLFDRRSSMLKLCSILVIVLTVGVGSAWADISLYTEGWESNHRESGTNNYTTTTKTYGSWTFYRSDAISNTGISGSYLARCRVAGSSTDSPYIVSSALTLSTDHISQVSWKCKGNTNISLTAYYSTDGSNWSVGKSATSLPSSSTSWSFNLDVTGTLYLKFVFTVASSTNSSRDGEIDDITVTGSHAAASKYTVSFETGTGNPSQADITEASGGAGITLPAGPAPTCSGDGWSFAGWKETSAVTSETTEAPTLLSAGSTFHPTGNVTLYAVYQKGELSTNYEKITSSAELTSGSNYVIARGTAYGLDANKYYMSSNDGYFGVTAISVSENVISNPSADLIWQISGDNTNGYSMYNSNRDLYIGYSTTYHDLYADDTQHKDYTITYTSSNFYIQSKSESSYYFATWSYSLQGGGSAYFFEINNSSAYVVLYKQTGTNTYFSNPTCCTALGTINGSFW